MISCELNKNEIIIEPKKSGILINPFITFESVEKKDIKSNLRVKNNKNLDNNSKKTNINKEISSNKIKNENLRIAPNNKEMEQRVTKFRKTIKIILFTKYLKNLKLR